MKRTMVLTLLAALLLAGCSPVAREPDELALVRVLGVDGKGPVRLTAVCGGTDQENGSRGACSGGDLPDALTLLPWAGEEELSLTSVSYLIVGQEVDLEEVLLTVLENEELGAASTVWLGQEGAGALLEACEDPASYLSLLTRQGAPAPTVVQALAALCTDGKVVLPLLSAQDGRPAWTGETVWEGGYGQ